MATTTRGGQARYVEFDEYVDSKIVRTRETIRTTDVLLALVAALAAVLGYLLLFVIADHWLGMDFIPPLVRFAIGLSILGGSTAWATWKIGLPHRRRINRLYVAREIETHESALEGNLLNLVDLQQADRDVGLPVMRSIEKRAAVGLSQTDLDGTVDRGPLMRSAYTLLGLVIAACLYTLLTVSLGLKPIGPSLLRAFGATGAAPTRIQFESVEIQKADGDSFVAADQTPRVPARFQPVIKATLNKALDAGEHVTLYFSTADQRFVDHPLEMRPVDGSLENVYPEYSVRLLGENERGLMQDISFRIEAGDAITPVYSIHVSTAPSASVTSVDYQYPDYMRLADESRDGANIEAWEGTSVTVHATTSQPVRSARLVFSDSEDTSQRAEEYPMHVTDGTTLSVQWRLAFRGDDPENYPRFYRIVCQDDQGATDLHPTLHTLAIRPDLPPEVELLDPRADLELPANAVVPLLIKARDPDFQLKHLTLRVEQDGKQLIEHNRELFAGEQPTFGPQSVDFPLEPLGLQPGQTISYWVEARDNKMPLGNRSNTAPKLNIRITEPVTPEEAAKQREERRKQQDEHIRQEQEKQQQEKGDQQEPSSERGDPKDENKQDAKDEKKQDAKDEPGQDGKPQKTDTPRDGDNKSDTPKSDRPKEQPGNNKDNQNTDPQGNKKGDSPEGKSGAQSDDSGNKTSESTKPGSGDPDPGADPLKTDGSDDAEALKRLRDFQKQQDAQKNRDEQPGSDPDKAQDDSDTANSSGKKKSETDKGSKNTGDDPKTATSSKKGDESKKGKTGNKTGSKGDTKNKKGATNTKDASGKKKDGSNKPNSRGTDPDGSQSQPKRGTDNEPPRKGETPSGDSTTKKKGAGGNKGKGSKPSGKPRITDKKDGDPDMKPGAGKKGGDAKGADKKGGGKKGGGKKGGGKKAGDAKGSDKKGGDAKGGDKKGGDAKDGDKKGGDAKGGDKKGGDKKDGSGDSAAKPGSKPGSKPSNKPGSKGGQGASGKDAVEGGGGSAKRPGSAQQGDEPGDDDRKQQAGGPNTPQPDPVNQDFSKEAANLVLKRLEDEINRGNVDPELLKQLGWTKDDVQKFANRLRDNVDTPADDTSPEAQARQRQFEDLLKSINITSEGTKRSGRSQRTRKTNSINAQDIPVPLQFREAVKLYRRNLTRSRTRAPLRPRTPAPPTK